jgi:hypothetical protein
VAKGGLLTVYDLDYVLDLDLLLASSHNLLGPVAFLVEDVPSTRQSVLEIVSV